MTSGCPSTPAGAHDDPIQTKMLDMPHVLIIDPPSEVAIQPGAVVSKVVHSGDGMNVTVFGFDAGQGLTEHQAARAAVVQVLSGRLRFTVDGEELELPPGSWLHMTPGTPHSLVANEPTIMLLTLYRLLTGSHGGGHLRRTSPAREIRPRPSSPRLGA